ncbi:hypothetical protein U1Q18_052297 [Sarracenia purpurea var. burkii]
MAKRARAIIISVPGCADPLCSAPVDCVCSALNDCEARANCDRASEPELSNFFRLRLNHHHLDHFIVSINHRPFIIIGVMNSFAPGARGGRLIRDRQCKFRFE